MSECSEYEELIINFISPSRAKNKKNKHNQKIKYFNWKNDDFLTRAFFLMILGTLDRK